MDRMIRARWVLVVPFWLAAGAAGQETGEVLEVVRRRYEGEVLAAGAEGAEAIWKEMGADGRWSDLAGGEVSAGALGRLEVLAVAWRRPGGDLQGRKDLLASIRAGIDAWIEDDPRHPNWFVNEVAVPRALGRAVVLLGRELGPERRRGVDRILERAWPPPRGPGGRGAAANLFYRVQAGVARALLWDAPDRLRDASDRAAAEIRIVRGEGLQADLSFHQHGPQFYSGSYGLEYLGSAAWFAALVAGTPFALPAEKVALLADFALDGLGWILCGAMIDPGAQGRNFSRKQAGTGGTSVGRACRVLAALETPRRAELAALADRLEGGVPGPGPPHGSRSFWRSDFLAHRRPGWYASVKMASTRLEGTESGNGEGLRQFHLADGAAFVMRDGTEYAGVQPAWDWRRIPGITCEQDEDPLPLLNWGLGARGRTRFAGSVSDGRYGVAALDFDRDRVRARKAWFFFDDGFVCLGSGIAGTGSHPVSTTLDQRLRRGAVVLPQGPLEAGRTEVPAPAWAWHDGVGYVVLDGSSLVVEAVGREGDWRDVNRRYDSERVSVPLFAAWLDHGARPEDASYAYAVLPGLAPGAIPAVRVVANGPALQAVHHDELSVTGLAFHEPGRIEVDGDLSVEVDRPCVLLAVRREGRLEISAANPAYAWPYPEAFRLTIRVGGGWEAPEGGLLLDLEDGRTAKLEVLPRRK